MDFREFIAIAGLTILGAAVGAASGWVVSGQIGVVIGVVLGMTFGSSLGAILLRSKDISMMDRPQAANRIRKVLKDVAKRQELITYSDLAYRMFRSDNPRDSRLADALKILACQDYIQQRPPITAVMVYRDERITDPAFIRFAEAVGLKRMQERAEGYWRRTLQDVYDYYG